MSTPGDPPKFEDALFRQRERTVDNIKRIYAVVYSISFANILRDIFMYAQGWLSPPVPKAFYSGLHLRLVMLLIFISTVSVFSYQADKSLDLRYALRPPLKTDPMPFWNKWNFAIDIDSLILTLIPFTIMSYAFTPSLVDHYGIIPFFLSYLLLPGLSVVLLLVVRLKYIMSLLPVRLKYAISLLLALSLILLPLVRLRYAMVPLVLSAILLLLGRLMGGLPRPRGAAQSGRATAGGDAVRSPFDPLVRHQRCDSGGADGPLPCGDQGRAVVRRVAASANVMVRWCVCRRRTHQERLGFSSRLAVSLHEFARAEFVRPDAADDPRRRQSA